MDKLRLALWVSLAALLYYLYITWQVDYPPQPTPTPAATASTAADSLPALPNEVAAPQPSVASTPTSATVGAPNAPSAADAPKIRVVTDVLDMDISTQGGDLIRADLPRYSTADKSKQAVRLFDPTPATYFAARSGLRAADDRAAPTHQAQFSSEAQEYRLADGQDSLPVKLTWTDGQGLTVTKTYTFKRGGYAIGVNYQVQNHSTADWRAASYVQLVRRQPPQETSMLRPETYSHLGPAAFDGKAYHKLALKKEEDRNYKGSYTGAWLAAMQHHFVAAAVPPAEAAYDYQLAVDAPNSFSFTYRGPLQNVAAGSDGTFRETLYVGPKLTEQLQPIGSRLDLTVDYGLFTILAGPLFWILAKADSFVGNWGWSIILVTVLIKAVFYKLTEASGKSMAKMREMAPRLKALQERYKDNREELGRATMEFYKREKINPLAGCLPMLVQMPVWMAFYWVILNSAEMRQAPFLYLDDLTSPDPLFILPILLGAVNFIQFKLNPQPADPMQAKIMMIMPLLMTAMMVLFPAGLALYWVTNTLLSILQQWHINRVVAAESKKS